jgi:flavin-dependent dehydrogenase
VTSAADFDADVFIAGGGPAGLAAAIAARQSGFRVLLADSQQPPIDKPCGEGLMPDGVRAARMLGVRIEAEQARPFRGILFQSNSGSVAADFPDGCGLGIRRSVLQQSLATAAAKSGAGLLWGERITGIANEAITLGTRRVRARWIVGADGTQSGLRRWAGLQEFRRDDRRFSFRQHFRLAPWSEYVEIHWGRRCQFYVTPVSAGEVSLVMMTRDPQLRIAAALQQFPVLRQRFETCEATTTERGALAATRKLRRVTRSNVALVGDASGTVDPITGDGLALAFKQAIALAGAFSAGSLSAYERAHAAIARRPRFMSDFMLLMDRSQFLQTRALTSFRARPHLFADLLAMHVGQLPPLRIAGTMAALGWQVATA